MKRSFGLKTIALALSFVLLFSYTMAEACTAVYVGKKVSTDGTTILARSEDQGNGAYNKMFVVVPRVENKPGRTFDDVNGFSYPLPATTYSEGVQNINLLSFILCPGQESLTTGCDEGVTLSL